MEQTESTSERVSEDIHLNKKNKLEKLYSLSNKTRYLILFSVGAVQILYSVIVYLILHQYLLAGICIIGGGVVTLSLIKSKIDTFQALFFAIIVYAYLIELSTMCFIEWEFGFQNYLIILLPLSFAFAYYDDNYEQVIPHGLTSFGFIFLCGVLCRTINLICKPKSGASPEFIDVINSINSFLPLIFCFIYILMFMIELYSTKRRLTEQEDLKVKNLRAAMMLSQIKPHFMYNTLSAIEGMIEDDPQAARKLLLQFSKYMRGNIDSVSSRNMNTIEEELNHVKAYADIITVCYRGNITFSYNIEDVDFDLPALSIQPIVENAVKHGIILGSGFGNVHIEITQECDAYVILVADNGCGFDIDVARAKKVSAGLRNVEFRIQAKCNGSVYIDSSVGKGTTVEIRIPKQSSISEKLDKAI